MKHDILDQSLLDANQLTPAGRWKRFGAYLVDIIPITFLIYFLFRVFGYMDAEAATTTYLTQEEAVEPQLQLFRERLMMRYTSFLVWLLYCIVMDASSYQGTYGKYLVNIKVVDEYGDRLTLEKSLVRNLSKILSYIVLLLGFVWILFDEKRQGWHDKIAKTLIVESDAAY